MSLDLSVVIVSYNTRDLLRGCLRSVFANLGPPECSSAAEPGCHTEPQPASSHSDPQPPSRHSEQPHPPPCHSEPEPPYCHSEPERSGGEESLPPMTREEMLRSAQRDNNDAQRLDVSLTLSYEVFVVDNASPDGSAAMVAREFPAVRLIANEENRGFAAANNQALAQAGGRHFLLLNPDTVVMQGAFERLVAFMDGNPRAGAAGVALLNPDGSPQHSCFHFPTLLMALIDFFPLNHRLTNSRWNGRYPLSRYAGPPFEIDHPLGACFVVRRAAAEQVGWFDDAFFIYCEEIDWCFRLKRAGWKIYCVPQAKVIHHGAQSTRQFRGPMLLALHRSRNTLFRKHYGVLYRYLARQITSLGAMAEARRARAAAHNGEIDPGELRQRLKTFEQMRHL